MGDENAIRERLLEELAMFHARLCTAEKAAADHRRTEEQLRRAYQTLTFHMENTPLAVLEWDAEFRLQRWSGQAEQIFGWRAEEVLGKHFGDWRFVHEEDAEAVLRVSRRLLDRTEPRNFNSNRNYTKSGAVLFCEWSNSMMLDDAGGQASFLSFVKDVTERKRAEEALRVSEAEHRAFFELASIGLIETDGETRRFLRANAPFCRMLGYSAEELFGKTILEITHPEDRAAVEVLREPPDGGERTSYTLEKRYLHKDGRAVWVEANVSLVRNADGRPVRVLTAVIDLTERKRADAERRKLESQIQHAQKLESLGVLAGGIAHDFNNLLTGVLGNASLALLDLPAASPARYSLRQIETAALRAADLTRQMLAYAGKGRFDLQAVHLSRIVEEMAGLLRTVISKKAVLRFDFTPDLPAVEADPTQIRQTVMNLITNASDALGDRTGVIGLRTGVMQADPAYLASPYLTEPLPGGRYAFLEVSDTGSGMDEPTRARMFDPFFSTKFTGRGLGLAAVLGIVRGHRGAIRVYSEPGKGTTIKVLLPCSERADDGPAAARVEVWRGSGLVLVVDDEEDVRSLTKRGLEGAGFRVVLASNGQEGVELFQRHGPEIVAVLLDLTMPVMGGEEAFREMRRLRPDVRVLLMSGYSEQEVVNQFAGKGLAAFVQKPFRPADLLSVLRRQLQG